MTIADLHALLTENGFYISDNNDFELSMMDGRPVTNIAISQTQETVYLGDTDEDSEGFERVVIL